MAVPSLTGPEGLGRRRSSGGRHAAPLAWAAAALAAASLLRVRDPHPAGSYGFCPILRATGLPCPGCGGLRSVNDLARGDVVGAVSSNAYVVASLCVLVLWWGTWVRARHTGRAVPLERRVVPVVALWTAGFLAFGALRLLPSFAWLRP